MNLSLDGYIAAPGDDIGWSVPSDELFQWWSDRVGATGLALYGRKLWETMSSHWPTADQQPGATPAEIEFARRWRDMPKVVFSSTTSTVDWNTRLVTGDAITEITRLKAEDGGPMDIGGATLAAAAMRAGLIDEYVLATAPVLVGSGTPFFTALDNWVKGGRSESVHRADPRADGPSPRWRGRRDSPPRGGPASSLLHPPPDPSPAPLTPRRVRVTIRETPRFAPRRPGIRIGSYRIHVLDVIAIVLGIAVLLAIAWPQ